MLVFCFLSALQRFAIHLLFSLPQLSPQLDRFFIYSITIQRPKNGHLPAQYTKRKLRTP